MPRNIETGLWAGALLRRAMAAGAMAVVAQKGDEKRGDVLVRVYSLDGNSSLYAPVFSLQAESAFRLLIQGSEKESARFVDQRIREDPDLWVIDIEDRQGRHFLTEAVISD